MLSNFDDCCNAICLKICSNQTFLHTGCKQNQGFFVLSILWSVAEVVIIHKIDALARFGYILDVWHHNPKALDQEVFFFWALYLKAPPSTEDSFNHQLEVRHPFQLITWRPSAIWIKNFLCFTLRKACWDLKGLPLICWPRPLS